MHLKRIELTNFRQHRQLDVDFEGNLIAILGNNGSGKSNLIGAIQFALTGEQPGFQKADLTTWGEKEGSVRLFFTAGSNNEEYCITRKTTGDVTLKVGGETIKQARKVEEALYDRIGLDKDLLRQVVFVNQTEITKLLTDDKKDRIIALQKIAGIASAAKIYEYLRPIIAEYDKPQGFDEAIAQAQLQLDAQESVAKTCRAALDRYEDALKALPTKEDLEAEVDRCAGASSAVSEHARVSASLATAQKEHEAALQKLAGMGAVSEDEENALRAEAAKLTEENEAFRTSLEAGREAVRFLTRMKELADAVEKARIEFGLAQGNAEAYMSQFGNALSDAKDEVDRLTAYQIAAESELRSLRALVASESSDGTCPVCGAPATQEDIARHLQEKLAAAERQSREATEKAAAARRAYDEREEKENEGRRNMDRTRSVYDSAFAALKKAHDAHVDGCEIDLETFRVAYRGQTPEALPDIQKENEALFRRMQAITSRQSQIALDLAKIASVKNEAKEARDAVSRLSAQIDLLVKSKEASAKKLASLGIGPDAAGKDDGGACADALRKARANLDAFNGILRDMAAEKGRLDAAEKTIASTRTFIADLVDKKTVEAKQQAKLDNVKRARDWYHYNEGPRLVSQQMLQDLTLSVNDYLAQFEAPFVVVADEDECGFRCQFIDGRFVPDPLPTAHMLSGGQKVTLAFALIIAIYMSYGGQLGFLSLDEPTAYLDDNNIGHMGELLEKVGAVARNKGLQILMATHEKAIMPFLDTKIDLMALKGE